MIEIIYATCIFIFGFGIGGLYELNRSQKAFKRIFLKYIDDKSAENDDSK